MPDFQFLDKRVQRTKRDLYRSLFELLEQKGYTKITIKQIIEHAGYSRGTFYTHYHHKDDLLNEAIDYLFSRMKKAYRSSYINESSIHVQDFVNEPYNLLKHFMQYGKYYQVLLSDHLQIDFRNKITNVIIDLYIEDFEMQRTSDEEEVGNRGTVLMYHFSKRRSLFRKFT